jgi:hypothetical protein
MTNSAQNCVIKFGNLDEVNLRHSGPVAFCLVIENQLPEKKANWLPVGGCEQVKKARGQSKKPLGQYDANFTPYVTETNHTVWHKIPECAE